MLTYSSLVYFDAVPHIEIVQVRRDAGEHPLAQRGVTEADGEAKFSYSHGWAMINDILIY